MKTESTRCEGLAGVAKLRLDATLAFARLLGVPVAVHQTFFMKGISWKIS
jgi:hypothetical protein